MRIIISLDVLLVCRHLSLLAMFLIDLLLFIAVIVFIIWILGIAGVIHGKLAVWSFAVLPGSCKQLGCAGLATSNLVYILLVLAIIGFAVWVAYRCFIYPRGSYGSRPAVVV
jgi:hypothetical protein